VPVLGVTGGIATGKSTCVAALLRHLPAEVFDADRCARQLLEEDAATISAVGAAFGAQVFDAQNRPSRVRLRELVFSSEAHRKTLEAILHPAIRARWAPLAETYCGSPSWLFVDIPLLFEIGAESSFDRTLVVACSGATQHRRLREERGLEVAMIEKIIGAQLALGAKIKKADHVIWNDSTLPCLDGQTGLFARWLTQYYG
jgi:dephospho-CoA kinase